MEEGVKSSVGVSLVLVIGVDELQNDEGDERLGLGVRKCACRDYKDRTGLDSVQLVEHAGQKATTYIHQCRG
jgi:hypothetical protein